MKKFLLILLVLVLLGGAGLYFGWAKASVPPGAYGVMRSKTHGTDPRVIRDGELRWLWYKLIPANTEIIVFSPRPVRRSINASGVLPSGSQYAGLAGIDADFSWEISGDFSFSVKPDALPSLAERQNLSSEQDLRELEEMYAGNIETFIRNYLVNLGNDGSNMEALEVSLTPPGLDTAIESAFPDIEGFSCQIRAARFPDFELYRSVKALYGDYTAGMRLVLREDTVLEAETRMKERLRLDTLNQYGELLTKYPILIQYLALEKGSVTPELVQPSIPAIEGTISN